MDKPHRRLKEEEIMLVLTRRPGEIVMIEPDPDTVGSDPLVWFDRPIEVLILRVEGNHVRIGIDAPASLRIWRGEKGVGGRGGKR